MAKPIVIAKNQTASPVVLTRLAVTVPASGQITLTDFCNFWEIQEDDQLRTEIEGGNILLNDGTDDLTATEALDLASAPAGSAAFLRTRWELVGVKDGANKVFTTTEFFVHDGNSNEALYFNGVLQSEGAGGDYVASESGGTGTGYDTVTMVLAPFAQESLTMTYVVL